ncbi:MBL fold metallo-hydrolase [Bacillus sp. Marseille-Q3570]|uniref:MBL fold metallo-hydrolase n=1 Tax=Bacillus sp. Marseille-Q3570 TaxID=2963522 RepID=UPI0021B75377|nr:MBL fold metallo-hydrolase [Bacillus sp. Marseille-Q3570]
MKHSKHGDVETLHVKATAGQMYLNYYLYYVDGLLIDTGPSSCQEEILPFLKSKKINKVALTHFHEDHTGNANWVETELGVELFIHPMSIDLCKRDGIYPDYRHSFWGPRKAFHASPIRTSVQSENLAWEAIHTPGHSRDHLSFFNHETGILFSGDLFVTPKPKVCMWQESVPTLMDSIRTVLSYDVKEMFCAHAGYVPNGKDMLQMKLDYLIETNEKITGLHQKGFSIEEINQQLYPKESPIIHISEKEWDSVHFVRSLVEDEPCLR